LGLLQVGLEVGSGDLEEMGFDFGEERKKAGVMLVQQLLGEVVGETTVEVVKGLFAGRGQAAPVVGRDLDL
jgi:hypothetical protein